jgi:hypothetical protein
MLGDNEELLLNNDYNQISLSCATPDSGVSTVSPSPPGPSLALVRCLSLICAPSPSPSPLQARTSGTAGCTLSSFPRSSTPTPACALRTAAAPAALGFEGGDEEGKRRGNRERCSTFTYGCNVRDPSRVETIAVALCPLQGSCSTDQLGRDEVLDGGSDLVVLLVVGCC